MIKKAIIFITVIIVVIAGIGFAAYKLTYEEDEVTKIVKKNEKEIKGYGIKIDDSDTDLYRKEYNDLKKNLESGNINYEEYGKSIAKLFIIDLYTMTNKLNKYDVGGIEFVLESARDNYTVNLQDTLYKYLEDNSNGERNQNLPEVSDITVSSIKENKFTLKNSDQEKTYDGYVVKLSWSYKIDYGYDTQGEVVIINDNNKLYIVEKN